MKNIVGKIAIIGLGYVGLPLALEFAKRSNKALEDANNEVLKYDSSSYSQAADFKSSKSGS